MLTIPNTPASPTAEQSSQSMPDQRDFDAIVAADTATGVVSGCATTQHGAGAMSVDVAAGAVTSSGIEAAVVAATVTITTADATNPRFDIIVASSVGTLSAVAGTPAAAASSSTPGPVFPAIPAGSVLLAAVYVRAATSSILTADIQDKRAGSLDALAVTNATPLANVTIPPGYTATVNGLPYTLPSGVLADVQAGGMLILDQGRATQSAAVATPGWFNVKDYGALGNDAADDTAAIQSAINAASVNGGVVYFPAGTYKVTATLTVNAHSVGLVGAGHASNISVEANLTNGITFVDASRCFMRDLRVSTSSTVTNVVLITATASTQVVTFTNVYVEAAAGTTNCFGVGTDTTNDVSEIMFVACSAGGANGALHGWTIGNGTVGNVTNIRAHSCVCRDMASDGVVMAGSAMQWYGGTVSNNGTTTPGTWDFHVTANYTQRQVVIEGVRSENSTAFFSQDFPTATYSPAPLILNCVITSFKATDKYAIVSNGKPAPTIIGLMVQNATSDPLIYSTVTGMILIDVTSNNPAAVWDPAGSVPQLALGCWQLDGSGVRTAPYDDILPIPQVNCTPASNVRVQAGYCASVQALPYTLSSGVLAEIKPGGVLCLNQ